MSDPFIGQVILFAGNFAPRGWAFCDGQLLSISSNSALFSILGTTYGGDGRTTFGLPDLRGRVSMHPGSGPGLSTRRLGERAGTETYTLNNNEVPAHSHGVAASSGHGDSSSPVDKFPAVSSAGIGIYASSKDATMGAGAISPSGGSQAHGNVQPSLGLNYIIALVGVFPSRN
jgi:microcystin-dependent protein